MEKGKVFLSTLMWDEMCCIQIFFLKIDQDNIQYQALITQKHKIKTRLVNTILFLPLFYPFHSFVVVISTFFIEV